MNVPTKYLFENSYSEEKMLGPGALYNPLIVISPCYISPFNAICESVSVRADYLTTTPLKWRRLTLLPIVASTKNVFYLSFIKLSECE